MKGKKTLKVKVEMLRGQDFDSAGAGQQHRRTGSTEASVSGRPAKKQQKQDTTADAVAILCSQCSIEGAMLGNMLKHQQFLTNIHLRLPAWKVCCTCAQQLTIEMSSSVSWTREAISGENECCCCAV
jgi:hypothetical protein